MILPDLDRKASPGGFQAALAFDTELGPLVNPVADLILGEDGEEIEPGNSLGWTLHRHRERQADDAEALRLFYVATTRARDALVLSSATDPTKKPTSPALALLDRRFDRSTGMLKASLPDGWNLPRIRVVGESPASGRSSVSTRRRQPRLLEVAKIIRDGAANPGPSSDSRVSRPRFVEHFDPAPMDLASGSCLQARSPDPDDPGRTLVAAAREAGRLAMVAARASRLQDPVSPDRLVQEAIGLIEGWSRSTLGREVAKAAEVYRTFPWVIRRSGRGRTPTLFQGRGDFLYRRATGEFRPGDLQPSGLGRPSRAAPPAPLGPSGRGAGAGGREPCLVGSPRRRRKDGRSAGARRGLDRPRRGRVHPRGASKKDGPAVVDQRALTSGLFAATP